MSENLTRRLLTKLSRTAEDIASLVDGLPQANVRVRPSPDEFSVLENICHLRDIEAEGYAVRIQRLLTEEQPSLPDLDGSRLAIERDYNGQDLNEALKIFTQVRQKNLAILSGLSDVEFQREGELEGVGNINLQKLVQMMADHDEGHVDELRVSRRRLLRPEDDGDKC